jgi:hypothetical protein
VSVNERSKKNYRRMGEGGGKEDWEGMKNRRQWSKKRRKGSEG